MAETITACIVTFNRKQLLSRCLDSLLTQDRPLDGIVLYDNASTDGTQELLRECGYLDDPIMMYTKSPLNIGGAAGFSKCMKTAFDAGYDWIWMMDDDVTPRQDCLSRLLQVYKETGGAFKILQPIRKDADTGRVFHYATKYNFWNPFEYEGINRVVVTELDVPYLEIISPPFEGPLIHRSVVADVGEIDGGYFMTCDDADWFLRAHRKGHRPLAVSDAVMIRASAPKREVFFDWKDYYTFRNRIELDRRYGNRWITVSRALYQTWRTILRSVKPGKLKHTSRQGYAYLFRALLDGIRGEGGKTVMP